MWIATPGSSLQPRCWTFESEQCLGVDRRSISATKRMAGAKAYPVHGGILADKIGYGKTA
jgi:hypothetical protein